MSIKWLNTGLTTDEDEVREKHCVKLFLTRRKYSYPFSFAPLVYAEACGLREKSTCPLSAVKNPRNPQQELT